MHCHTFRPPPPPASMHGTTSQADSSNTDMDGSEIGDWEGVEHDIDDAHDNEQIQLEDSEFANEQQGSQAVAMVGASSSSSSHLPHEAVGHAVAGHVAAEAIPAEVVGHAAADDIPPELVAEDTPGSPPQAVAHALAEAIPSGPSQASERGERHARVAVPKEDLLKSGYFGVFRVTPKQPTPAEHRAGTFFGGWQATCKFPCKEQDHGLQEIHSVHSGHARSTASICLLKLCYWTTLAPHFARQSEHMKASLDPLPSREFIKSKCIFAMPADFVLQTDEELDAVAAPGPDEALDAVGSSWCPTCRRHCSGTWQSSCQGKGQAKGGQRPKQKQARAWRRRRAWRRPRAWRSRGTS